MAGGHSDQTWGDSASSCQGLEAVYFFSHPCHVVGPQGSWPSGKDWTESSDWLTPCSPWMIAGSLLLSWAEPGPLCGRLAGVGSRVGGLGPLPIPQQAWSLLIHLFIHSFIQIVFVEHVLCVGPPGLRLVNHRPCHQGAHSLVGKQLSVTYTVVEEALVSWS